MVWASPEKPGVLDLIVAEIGRIASKYQSSSSSSSPSSSSSGKTTSLSSRGSGDVNPVEPIEIEQPQQDSLERRSSSVLDENSRCIERQQSISDRDSFVVTSVKLPSEVTSTAEAATEVPGAIKTTINIGIAMNHVNDQENLKQLNLAPVQVNEVEEMDTQEGMFYPHMFGSRLNFFSLLLFAHLCFCFHLEGYRKCL